MDFMAFINFDDMFKCQFEIENSNNWISLSSSVWGRVPWPVQATGSERGVGCG